MVEKEVQVGLKSGLQARQAALFVQEAIVTKQMSFCKKKQKK